MRLQNPVCAAGKKPGGSPQEGSEKEKATLAKARHHYC